MGLTGKVACVSGGSSGVGTEVARSLEQWARLTPTGRLATVAEVAATVTFLASAANGSVTAAAVRVSRGL